MGQQVPLFLLVGGWNNHLGDFMSHDFVHPGKFSLLELVQLTMKLHRAYAPARGLVDLLLALQAPVVRIAGSPGVLLAGRDLLVIQVQLGAIAPCDLHDGFSLKMC